MEHRNLDHHTVSGGKIHSVADYLAVVDDISVRQHNALGESRCSRCVLHIANVVGFNERSAATDLLSRNERGARKHLLPGKATVHIKADGYNVAQEGKTLGVKRLTGIKHYKKINERGEWV